MAPSNGEQFSAAYIPGEEYVDGELVAIMIQPGYHRVESDNSTAGT